MNITDLLDTDLLRRHLAEGMVRAQVHPTEPLTILNYTQKAQWTNTWDPVTRACRGLIIDDAGTVIARPFPKFFNLSEHQGDDPHAGPIHLDPPIAVYEKMDGCFERRTTLNLWGGGTITIGEVVSKRLPVTLIGMDADGNLVPSVVTDWHHNGRKDHWLDIEIDAPVSRASGAGGHPNRIRVTVNHSLYLNGAYTPAAEAKPGDSIVTQGWEPSAEVLELIRNSMLGDGSLVASATKPEQACYQEPHCIRHIDYVEAIRKALGDTATSAASTTSGYGTEMAWACSREYRVLGDMRREWYPDGGPKRVPLDLSWLDDKAVAKWYMDDGSLAHTEGQRDRALFATNGFTQADVTRLGQHLAAAYDVSFAVYDSKGWCLRVNAGRQHNIERFWRSIAPHVHPAMRYKLPAQYRDEPYVPWETGHEVVVPRPAKVVSVSPVANTKHNFPSGRTGFDITTETNNYLARGMLVHNSLGIAYRRPSDGQVAWATRGSFTSTQAVWATEFWRSREVDARAMSTPIPPDTQGHYLCTLGVGCIREAGWWVGDDDTSGKYHCSDHWPELIPDLSKVTVLAEIIYPANRIVVDYGDATQLVLLAVLDIESGRHLYPPTGGVPPLEAHEQVWTGGSVTSHMGYLAGVGSGTLPQIDNAEGFVLLGSNDVRVKVKFPEYLRLHALLTGITAVTIWDHLRTGSSIDRMREGVPDEFLAWVDKTVDELHAEFALVRGLVESEYAELLRITGVDPDRGITRDDRKAFALEASKHQHPHAMFLLLDGNDDKLTTYLWAQVKPERTTPFTVDPDEVEEF